MTKVRFYQDKKHYEVDIVGHAEYDFTGKDIVCSAVSALGFTLANAVLNTECDNDVHMEPGNIHIVVDATEEALPRLDTVMQTIKDGYCMLANKYPDNVVII